MRDSTSPAQHTTSDASSESTGTAVWTTSEAPRAEITETTRAAGACLDDGESDDAGVQTLNGDEELWSLDETEGGGEWRTMATRKGW